MEEKLKISGYGATILVVQVLMSAYLTAARMRHSTSWCEKKLVGPMRDIVRIPEGVTLLDNPMSEARRISGGILTAHCEACGRCELGVRH